MVVRGSPWAIRQNTEERATAYAIGKRSMIIRKKLPSNIRIAMLFTSILLLLLYIKASDMIGTNGKDITYVFLLHIVGFTKLIIGIPQLFIQRSKLDE